MHNVPHRIGDNRNISKTSNTLTSIPVSPLVAIKLLPPNSERVFFEVSILPGPSNVCMFIRLYPEIQDNIVRGVWIGRYNSANDVFFKPAWRMPERSNYTGEISAILMDGDAIENAYVTEY